MRRGPKPAKSKEAKPPVARKSSKNDGAKVRDLEKRLADSQEQLQTRDRELVEAQEQQTAMAEILQSISSSPSALTPVLDTIARNAISVCGATDATDLLLERYRLGLRAHRGPLVVQPVGWSYRATRGSVPGRAVIDGRPVQVPDVMVVEDLPEGRAFGERYGIRAAAAVPLVREGVAIGALMIRRAEAGAFSDKQMQSLASFADQAVIAIENVRLFKELEARNRDLTATSEILQVISRSPTEVQPVFAAIVERAVHVCGGIMGNIYTFDGELIHHAAGYNPRPGSDDFTKTTFPRRPGREMSVGRAVLDRAVVHIADVDRDPEYSTALARARGARCVIAVPLLRGGRPMGAIVVGRPEPGPFSDDQVELLKTFADQAVIAIENVRLFKEL